MIRARGFGAAIGNHSASRRSGMGITPRNERAATGSEIREILGAIDDGVIAGIAALGATREDILEAKAWLASDDDMHRLHHALHGRVALVFEILEAQLPEAEDRRG
jgi:hypothetical protein